MKSVFFVILLTSVFLASCDDNNNDEEEVFNGIKFEQTGALTVNLSHKFNNQNLVLGTNYVTALNDTVNLSEFKYYLSCIQLQTKAGNWIELKNYNLVNLDVPLKHALTFNNIPANTYTKIKFIVGVDSLENFDGLQTGDLDVTYGMYWNWAMGYVFFRIKGRYNGNNSLTLDLGGNDNLPHIELDLSQFKNKGSAIKLNTSVDLAEIFVSPNNYKLDGTNDAMHRASYPACPLLRDNIETGVFKINSVE